MTISIYVSHNFRINTNPKLISMGIIIEKLGLAFNESLVAFLHLLIS